jgi:hypothetical protein
LPVLLVLLLVVLLLVVVVELEGAVGELVDAVEGLEVVETRAEEMLGVVVEVVEAEVLEVTTVEIAELLLEGFGSLRGSERGG